MVHIEVVYCPRPGSTDTVALALADGASAGDALSASGLLARHGLTLDGLHVGVWGRAQPVDHKLRDRDRVEIYRPLQVDPKEARRQRYQKQKTTGRADKARPFGTSTS